MNDIRSRIHRHLPWLGLRMRALLDALLLSGGSVGRAEDVAARLGLGNRLQLAAAAYRLVARITGRSWSEVRSVGMSWVLNRFLGECGEGATTRKQKRRGRIPAAPSQLS